MKRSSMHRWARNSALIAFLAGTTFAMQACSKQADTLAKAEQAVLETVASSDSAIWNAVVADGGRYFVAGPRWAGGSGPQLSKVESGSVVPYPDAGWNNWKPGDDGSHKFVNINALHQDPQGHLWAVDTGSPQFGGDPLPGAAKLVEIDLAKNQVIRVIPFPADVALKGSYVDDIRFNGKHGYLTDAGNAGIIVLDLETGKSRRVLDKNPATVAESGRPIVISGQVLKGPNDQPLLVQSDPLEVSPDGKWFYFGPLEGPWSQVPTKLLDDPNVPAGELAKAVKPFVDLPPMGGSVMDKEGNLYFSQLEDDSIRKRAPDGTITTIASDPRLHWVDAMFITPDGRLLMPAAQIDRVALFSGGTSHVDWPVSLFSLKLTK